MSAKRRSHDENEGFEHIPYSAFVPDCRVRQGFTEHRKARRVFFFGEPDRRSCRKRYLSGRTEQPIPPATEEPKPSEPPQPTQPSTEPPTEPSFDIGYWVNFAKSYAESVGLTLDSGAAYCWDNPIAAGSKCRYTERDIKGYLDRYAKDSDITEVWVWYEQTSGNSYEVYIGYA